MVSKRTVALTAVSATLAGALSITAAQAASAASTGTGSTSLVDALVNKFHLDRSQVQQVFTEHQTNMRQQHENQYEARLQQAVTDGKLTTDQKAKILAKHQALEAQREANQDILKNQTPEQRRSARQQQRQDLQAWATANNIPLQYLMPFGHGHAGPGGPDGPGPDDQAAPAGQ